MTVTLLHDRDAFRKAMEAERGAGRTVGLVPTMGSLHAGHSSLMARAARECEVVAVSIYVNPLQFGPAEDLAGYPRDLPGDLDRAEAEGVGYVFAPSGREMFPDRPRTSVEVADLGGGLEGADRPGHFSGVATIVTKLLALTGPCRAYFGEKDYQQLAVIRQLVADLSLAADVVACPTVRDPDGVALSSRNAYLTPAERAVAPAIHRALLAGREAVEGGGERRPGAVRSAMAAVIGREPAFTLGYAEVVSAADLHPIDPLTGEVRLLIAARLGRARLIDNMGAHA
jgi:pantoate--beta-alanine ligase